MAADIATYDKALKEDYEPAMEKQLNSKTPLLKRVRRSSDELEGRQFVLATEGRRTEGVGSRPSSAATLPTPGEVGIDNATGKAQYFWGVIQIDEPIIEHAKRDSGSFTRPVGQETKGLAETMAMDLNRQLYNDGSGVISQTGVTSASTTVVLTTTGGYRALGNGRLRVGMFIDILTRSNGTAIATNRKITAVNATANTIVISGAAVTTATTDAVYRQGSHEAGTTVSFEMPGLRNIVLETGALFGLNPATAGQEYWAARRYHNSGSNRAISEVLMQIALDDEEDESNGEISAMISHKAVRRSYFNLLVGLKRFVDANVKKLEGGFTALEFSGRPFFTDKDCKGNSVYFLDESKLKFKEVAKPGWMDRNGSILQWDGGTGWKAVYRWFATFMTNNRAALSVLEDITES